MAATDGVRASGRWQRLMVYEPLGGGSLWAVAATDGVRAVAAGVRASGRWQRLRGRWQGLMVYEPLDGGSD